MVLTIILLIVFGVFLILLEFFVVPGVTIAGIGGLLLIIAGIYFAYESFPPPIGHYFLTGSIFLIVGLVYYALRSKTWNRLGLKNSIDSKVDTHDEEDFKVGDVGICLTRLAPAGKVMVNEKSIEAQSISGFLDPKEPIEVVQVLSNKLIVKRKI